MRTFVTGATNAIGARVVARLIQRSHSVRCLVKGKDDSKSLSELGAELVEGKVTDMASLLTGMEGCDWVVNLAEVHSIWEPRNSIYEEINVTGTRNVMECALEANITKVVHLSHAILHSGTTRQLSWGKGAVDPAGLSNYARTKHEGDKIAWELYQQRALPLVLVYTGNVVGLNNRDSTTQHIKNVITRRVRVRAFDDVVATYVAVQDLAEAIVRALEKDNNIGERYLVGNARLSVREFDEILNDITGVPLAKVRVPEPLVFLFAALSGLLLGLVNRPPAFGISTDALREFTAGLIFDGSRAQKELDLDYTPIRNALEEAIYSH